MKLEVGKYYKTRDGRKVGPMVEDFEGDYMALHPDLGYLVTWMHDGARWRREAGLDIVSEWPADPTTGTLAELGVKPGDVVALAEAGPILQDMIGLEATVDHDGHAVLKNGSYFDPAYDEEYGRKYRLVSRARTDLCADETLCSTHGVTLGYQFSQDSVMRCLACRSEGRHDDLDASGDVFADLCVTLRTPRAKQQPSASVMPGPVITETVTTKKIVTGRFGEVHIGGHSRADNRLRITIDGWLSRTELIAARDILSQLIDAMAPQA